MRYLDIRTLGPDCFQVWTGYRGTETVIMLDLRSGKFDFNRLAVGLPVKKNYRPPALNPGSFTKREAIHVAHTIGNYLFDQGDLVYTYTTVDGRPDLKFFD